MTPLQVPRFLRSWQFPANNPCSPNSLASRCHLSSPGLSRGEGCYTKEGGRVPRTATCMDPPRASWPKARAAASSLWDPEPQFLPG